MIGGGLMRLVAYGAQDQYLIDPPLFSSSFACTITKAMKRFQEEMEAEHHKQRKDHALRVICAAMQRDTGCQFPYPQDLLKPLLKPHALRAGHGVQYWYSDERHHAAWTWRAYCLRHHLHKFRTPLVHGILEHNTQKIIDMYQMIRLLQDCALCTEESSENWALFYESLTQLDEKHKKLDKEARLIKK